MPRSSAKKGNATVRHSIIAAALAAAVCLAACDAVEPPVDVVVPAAQTSTGSIASTATERAAHAPRIARASHADQVAFDSSPPSFEAERCDSARMRAQELHDRNRAYESIEWRHDLEDWVHSECAAAVAGTRPNTSPAG
jgi:hypothetical protein